MSRKNSKIHKKGIDMSDSTTHTEGLMPHGPTLPNTSNLPAFTNTGWNGNILLFFVALGFGILFCNLWHA
ncbi:unnamed protein product [Pneumocystis jirovecii]|uniref:Uncharacterized protein n=1 Tax=Pneumocystis jirovecii TaxID=42068 RepID=L0PE39_PNEJI|nr:unnamed protein product [Pneumocystis jirovecii]